MRLNTASGLVVLCAITACTEKPPVRPAAPDAAAIQSALTAEYGKLQPLMQKKDAAGAAAMYTEDATWILPDASTFKGRAEIEKGAKGFFDSYESATLGPVAIDKLVVISDSAAVAFVRGSYTVKMKGKKAEDHVNPYVDYWVKGADGMWRIAYEVNADGLAPAAPAAPAKKAP